VKFASRVFSVAGIYGLIAMVPQYFLEAKVGHDYPPAITHPEYFYGFIGVTIAWQLVFLAIARDPVRLRPVMPAAMVEKITFGVASIVLFASGRIPLPVLGFACIDLVLLSLFIAAYRATAAAAKD
jgi:hypothetical protein